MVAKQRLSSRIAATQEALAAARAELAETRKRQTLLQQMAERKEAAIASFVDKWSKQQMARIEKAMKPRKRSKRH